MIPSWLIIGSVTIGIIFIFNRLSRRDSRWFRRLRRPDWLTFDWAIPLIWISIFICGAWSAYIVWETQPGSFRTWLFMVFYLALEIAIMLYTPVMCKLRSLKIGTIIGGTGFFLGLILAVLIRSISLEAFWLLVPYLIWSPIGTFVTWQMMYLNPRDI